jgi:hypothetical protein
MLQTILQPTEKFHLPSYYTYTLYLISMFKAARRPQTHSKMLKIKRETESYRHIKRASAII